MLCCLYYDAESVCYLSVRPQCDHTCQPGSFSDYGERVATVLLYCKVPATAGVTVFPKADIIIKPKQYSAVLVSYVGSDGQLDEGIVERSECPVTAGMCMFSFV